jgi:hypothetical protein
LELAAGVVLAAGLVLVLEWRWAVLPASLLRQASRLVLERVLLVLGWHEGLE